MNPFKMSYTEAVLLGRLEEWLQDKCRAIETQLAECQRERAELRKRLNEELESQRENEIELIALNKKHSDAFRAAGVTRVDYSTDHGGIGYQTAQADVAVREIAEQRDELRKRLAELEGSK